MGTVILGSRAVGQGDGPDSGGLFGSYPEVVGNCHHFVSGACSKYSNESLKGVWVAFKLAPFNFLNAKLNIE
jgi:hypothetical protein